MRTHLLSLSLALLAACTDGGAPPPTTSAALTAEDLAIVAEESEEGLPADSPCVALTPDGECLTLDVDWYYANGQEAALTPTADADLQVAAVAIECVEPTPTPTPVPTTPVPIARTTTEPAPACPPDEWETILKFYRFRMNVTAGLTEHSATRVIRRHRQWQNGAWVIVGAEVTDHPNHGRGPAQVGGVNYRNLSTGWTPKAGKGFTTYPAVAGKKCATGYGFFGGSHVCHGDTDFQWTAYSRHLANLAPPNAAGYVNCTSGLYRVNAP